MTKTEVNRTKERRMREGSENEKNLNKSVELLDAQTGLAGAGAERKDGWRHSHSCEDNILFLLVPLT